MSDENDTSTPIDPLAQPFLEMWAGYVRQSNDATKQVLEGLGSSTDPAAWRKLWFEALTRNTEVYYRSPLFLQMLKAQIDVLIQAMGARRQAQQHDAPADGGSDAERAINARLEQLESRLQAVENRIGEPGTGRDGKKFLNQPPPPPAAPRSTIGGTPHKVVYQEGTAQLLRYENPSIRFAEPILICYALVNRPYILDLQDDRSVIRRLLDGGFDVYLIDWGVPTEADHDLRLQDYVCRLLRNVADFVCQEAESAKVNLLGYCMGGTLSTMFTALFPERVRNLILMATPIDFSGDEGLLNLWAREEFFDVDKLVDTCGNCPGEFLQFCFQLMKPVQNFAEKYLSLCENLEDEAFLHNFVAMERWVNDSIPVAGETFREFVKLLYQQNRLVKGELLLGEAPVKLESITCPVLLLVAEKDHLVPPGSTLALEKHVNSDEVKSMSINSGHIGLAVSSKAHRQFWPEAVNWIAEHSTAKM
jgi:poly[(R)-3-hydroxyalkanoate] polymerase subunit PhaC